MAMERSNGRTNVDWRIGLDSELDDKHDNDHINHDF
jgi:hypothetical protein